MKTIYSIIFSLFLSAQVFAQDSHFMMSWDVTVPLGETADYTGEVSWLGFSMQWRKFMTDHVSVGLNFSWNVLSQRTSETEEFKFTPDGSDRPISGTLTGEQFRYLNSFPILVEGHYYTGDPYDSAARFFAGGGIGVTPIQRRTEIGTISVDDTNWHFTIAPEIGVLFPLDDFGIYVAANYNYALKVKETIDYSFLTFNVGLMF